MSKSDPRFAANIPTLGGRESGSQLEYTTGTISNLTWDDSPTYPDPGNSVFFWGQPSGILNISKCVSDWREGPRAASTSTLAIMNIDQCFINTVGKSGDHADGIQWFLAAGAVSTVNITNTCFRIYDNAEAVATYGAGFVESDAIFWSDNSQGNLSFNNVLFWGGGGTGVGNEVQIHIDAGGAGLTTNISFINCYFVPSPGNTVDLTIIPNGGTLNVLAWTNVVQATIVNGVIIPGAAIPHP